MLKNLLSPILLLSLVHCSATQNNTTPLTSCDPTTDRVGTYLVHFDTVSGNCGAIPDELTIVAADQSTAASTCTVINSTWSDGNCRNDLQKTCNGGITVTGFTVQQSQDGSLVTGEETLTQPSCAGTYNVTWTRQ